MNNERRNHLKEILEKINILKNKLEGIGSDEEFAYDNMPEGLKNTLNGMNSEDAIEKINEAIACIDEAIECIETII